MHRRWKNRFQEYDNQVPLYTYPTARKLWAMSALRQFEPELQHKKFEPELQHKKLITKRSVYVNIFHDDPSTSTMVRTPCSINEC
jgi:hypothetical protein